MTDDKYTLVETNKERAALARSSRHRKSGSRSRKVPMRTDNMTAAQLRKENGPVMTYNMNAPITMRALRTWPVDLQREYMRHLDERFAVPGTYIADMLGISVTSLSRYRARIGALVGNRVRVVNPSAQAAWDRFLGTDQPEPVDVSATDGHEEDAPAVDPAAESATTTPDLHATGAFRRCTVELDGNMADCVKWLISTLGDKDFSNLRVSMTVRFEEVG